VILPLLRNLATNYTENHIDTFYTESVVLSMVLPHYAQICREKNFPETDEEILGELPIDC
jgi:hypothetical protein